MITRCNQCGTKFEISAELLQAEDPTVRCGECMALFNARSQLVADADNVPVLTRSVPEPVTASPVVPAVSESTAVASARLPEVDLETADTLLLEPALGDDTEEFTRQYGGGASVAGEARPNLDFSSHFEDRVDPVIGSIDDEQISKSLEFEKTLALDGLTGIEPEYVPHRDTPPARSDERFREVRDPQLRIPRGNPRDFDLERRQSSADYDHDSRSQYYPHAGDEDGQPPVPVETDIDPSGRIATGDRDRQSGSPASAPDAPERSGDVSDLIASASYARSARSAAGVADNQPRFDAVTGLPVVAAGDPLHLDDDILSEAGRHSYGRSADIDSAQNMQAHMRTKGVARYLDDDQQQPVAKRSASRWVLPVIGLLVFACACLFLARDNIARLGLPQPVLSAFCGFTGCELPVQKDIDSLEIMRRKMYSHPTLDNVLVISVDLLNKAAFPQTYPVLVVTMANGEGQPVAHRKFAPEEYQSEEALGSVLPSGKPVRINFDIIDPGVDAQSFELEFE